MDSLDKANVKMDKYNQDALSSRLQHGALTLMNELRQNKVCCQLFRYNKEQIHNLTTDKVWEGITTFETSMTLFDISYIHNIIKHASDSVKIRMG